MQNIWIIKKLYKHSATFGGVLLGGLMLQACALSESSQVTPNSPNFKGAAAYTPADGTYELIYRGVCDYGAPETVKENVRAFRYCFSPDLKKGDSAGSSADSSAGDSAGSSRSRLSRNSSLHISSFMFAIRVRSRKESPV